MVGNDIVDLNIAFSNSRWLSSRFVDKIFTSVEKKQIEESADAFQTIWRLWSMKESAYKIYLQQHKSPFFDPQKIQTQILSKTDGVATIQNYSYVTTTKCSTSYMYTESKFHESESLFSKLFATQQKHNSEYCKEQLINYFAHTYKKDPVFLQIKKNSLGVPKLFFKNELQNKSISITHHGDYAAICFN